MRGKKVREVVGYRSYVGYLLLGLMYGLSSVEGLKLAIAGLY